MEKIQFSIKDEKKILISMAVALIAATIFELFVFNFSSIISAGYGEGSSFVNYEYALDNLTYYGEGLFKIGDASDYGSIYVAVPKGSVKNVYVEMGDKVTSNYVFNKSNEVDVSIYQVNNDGSEKLLGKAPMVYEMPISHYVSAKHNDAEIIRIDFFSDNTKLLRFYNVSFNTSKTMYFSITRFAILFGIIALVLCFNKDSRVWKIDAVSIKDSKKWIFIAPALIFLIVFGEISLANGVLNSAYYNNGGFDPYNEMARAWVCGQSLIDYYGGVYTESLGALPVIFMYFPVLNVFGATLPFLVPVLLLETMFLFGAFLVIKKIYNRYFELLSLGGCSALFLAIMFGSGLTYFISQPDAQAVCTLFGMVLTVWALYAWQCDSNEAFAVGSLLMSLNLLVKPVFILYAVLILIPEIRIKLKNKKVAICSAIALAVGIIGMLLDNRARLGSAFDFGKGFIFSRGLDTLGERLFAIPVFSAEFPFVTSYGGVIVCNMAALLGVTSFALYRKKREAGQVSIYMTMVSIIVMVISDNVYDGLFMLIISSTIVGAYIFTDMKNNKLCLYASVIIAVAIVFMILINSFTFFIGDKGPLYNGNTDLYYQIYYSFMQGV